jgi:hypothetical protein
MDFNLDLNGMIQAVLIGAIVWHVKSVRDLVAVVQLHDWRLTKLEEQPVRAKCERSGDATPV